MPPSPEDGHPPSEPSKGGRQDGPAPPTAHSPPPQRAGPDAGKVPKWLKLPGKKPYFGAWFSVSDGTAAGPDVPRQDVPGFTSSPTDR
ncbi:unnamed protein product [Arctogadus glacialis]